MKNRIFTFLVFLLFAGLYAWGTDIDVSAIVNDQSGTLLTSGEQVRGTNILFGVNANNERVANDDPSAILVVSGKYHGEHGLTNASFSVVVPGNVEISVGECTYSAKEIVVKNSSSETVASTIPSAVCWKNDHNNVAVLYYTGPATTLTIYGMDYCPFIGVKSVAVAPTIYTVTYANADGATGIVPAAENVESDSEITLPRNRAMYKEGYTLTGWSDGVNTYSPGATYTVTSSVTLTAVYTSNSVALDDREAPVTIKWQFGKSNGMQGNVSFNGVAGFIVAQANVNGNDIDVKLAIDATSGKFAPGGNQWAQVNNGTVFEIPSTSGAIISYRYYDNLQSPAVQAEGVIDENTIDGVTSYTITNDAAAARKYYMEYIQVVFPSLDAINYSIDFTNSSWTSELSTSGATNRCWVTGISEGVPTYSTSDPGNYLIYFEGYFKNNTYGLYYGNPRFVVSVPAGKYKITLGCSDYGGDIPVSDGTSTLTTINNSGGKYASDHSNISIGYINVNSPSTITVTTTSNNVYFPYFAIEAVDFVPVVNNGFVIVDNSGTESENGTSLKNTINYASASSLNVFIPNGTYDLGDEIDATHPGITISRAMNIIGESMDGVLIKAETESENESINSATVKIEHGVTGVYLQNLTIQNYAKAFNVSTSAERAVALWDRGNQTVLKNVYLKGTQDTYYTNKTEVGQQIYYEGGKIEGTVDFICGAGDVYFEKTNLYTANSATASKTTGDYIAAPRTFSSENYGYVFNECVIDGEASQAGTYYLARAWAETPRCTFVSPDYSVCEPAAAKWGTSMGPVTYYFSETTTPISSSTVLGSAFASAARTKIDMYTKELTLNNISEASHGYATFCSSWNFTITGAKAYKAALSGSSLVLTELSGIIPAGGGVIIMGDKGATVTISYSPLDETADMSDNILEGTTSYGARPQTKTNFYAFDKTDNKFKIYTGTNFPANKAFFQTDAPVAAPVIRIFNEENNATDIESLSSEDKAVKFIRNGRILILRDGITYDALGRIVK